MTFLHFFCVILYSYMAGLIFVKNPRFLINILSSVIFICFAIWSFSMIFLHNPDTTKSTALLFYNIGSFGLYSVSSLLLWFFLVLAEKKKILKTKLFYILIFFVPLFFLYIQWNNLLIVDNMLKANYGWKEVYTKSIWPYLFYLYTFFFIATGFIIVYVYIKKTKEALKKKQAEVILATGVITLIFSILAGLLFPQIIFNNFPDLGNVFVILWVVGIFYAITKYKLFELSPITAAENIISTISDLLFLVNPGGIIKFVNKAGLEYLGYEKNELINQPLEIVFEKKDEFKKILQINSIHDIESTFKTKESKNISISVSTSSIVNENEILQGIILIGRDITERKIAEKKLEEKNKQLENALININVLNQELHELNITKDKIYSIIAHDLKSPFNTLLGFLEVLEEGIEEFDLDFIKKSIHNINEKSKHVYDLLLNLLEWSTSKTGMLSFNPEVADIYSIVNQNIILLDANVEKKEIKLISEIEKGTQAYFDKKMISTVFRNLLSNAIKYTCKGGVIKVKSNKKDNLLEISVIDNGVGISTDHLNKLFKINTSFSTIGTENEKGTGLGLILCKEFVEKNGGKIWIKSEIEKGSTFKFTLPIQNN